MHFPLRNMLSSPIRFARRLPSRLRNYVDRTRTRADFLKAVDRTPPVPLDSTGPVEVRILCGTRQVGDAIASLKSLYRFTPARYPLVIHEDGSLTAEDKERLHRHFPGVFILLRSDADQTMNEVFRRADLPRCREFRDSMVLALKVFDIPWRAQGKRLIMMDTDILFHNEPTTMLAALAVPDSEWVDRYNEDVITAYCWTDEQIRLWFGVEIQPAVNTGLLLLRPGVPDWTHYESWLAQVVPWERRWLPEQTLLAMSLSMSGAKPLPREYDVCFHHSHGRVEEVERLRNLGMGEKPVVTQHYCGGYYQRQAFYRHFTEFVAPQLMGASGKRAG